MLNLIVAVSQNRVIGKDNNLPWRISEDLKNFKKFTMDGILFVGKKTAQSLPPLPGREIIIVKRDSYPLLADAREIALKSKKIGWIGGGGEIYKAALQMNICDKIYLTMINKDYDGDTFFPLEQLNKDWVMGSEEILRINEPYITFQIWNRK